MIPYSTPAKTGASLVNVQAASALINEYCSADHAILANTWETLHLPTQYLYSPSNSNRRELVVMLPKRPLWLARLQLPETASITGVHLTDRDYQIEKIEVDRSHTYQVTLQALWGWQIPDRTGMRTWNVTDVFTELNGSTLTESIKNNFEVGDVLNIYETGNLYNEYAYVIDENTVQRYEHLTGIVMLDPLTANAKVEKVVWPADLQFATGVAARRMEQLQRTPGYHGSDMQNNPAIIHNIARTLNTYRSVY